MAYAGWPHMRPISCKAEALERVHMARKPQRAFSERSKRVPAAPNPYKPRSTTRETIPPSDRRLSVDA